MSKNENIQKQREIELLEELVKWIRVTSISQVKKILEDNLETPNEKITYQASDGVTSQGKIADLANVNQSRISEWGKVWIRNGIAKAVSAKGGQRAVRLFSLEDFGIEVPDHAPKLRQANALETKADVALVSKESQPSAEAQKPQYQAGPQ